MCRKNLAVQPVRLASGTAAIALLLMLATPAGVTSAADLSPAPADAALDSDGDGISDVDEINRYGTDHRVADTDSDGLLDGEEVYQRHTDPNRWDTDGDALGDGEEVMVSFSDPNLADSDGDGLRDGAEVYQLGTSPVQADRHLVGASDVPVGTDLQVAGEDLVDQSIR